MQILFCGFEAVGRTLTGIRFIRWNLTVEERFSDLN